MATRALTRRCGRRARLPRAAAARRWQSTTAAAPEADEWFDVTIVGGGPVGATVAASLAAAPAARRMRIALLDAAPPAPPLPPPPASPRWTADSPPEARAYALSPTSAEILESVGVWDEVVARPVGRYDRMQVWDELGGGFVRLGDAEGAEPGAELGFVVEDRVLAGTLWARLASLAEERRQDPAAGALELIRPAKVQSTVFPPEEGGAAWPTLTLDDGRVLGSRLLVDATGGFSPLRTQAGFRTVGVDYHQKGVVAAVALAEEAEGANRTAWQRFLPSGPLALLPMGSGFSTVVWSCAPPPRPIRRLSVTTLVGVV